MVELPETLRQEIDTLVRSGAFPNAETAVSELVRLGLDVLKSQPRQPFPRTPPPPGLNPPDGEQPINVNPTDVTWM